MSGRSLPIHRSDCVDGPRPCPHHRCRHHLFHADVVHTSESCSLDLAERGGLTYDAIGALLGMSHTRVQQIEAKALAKLTRHVDRTMIAAFAHGVDSASGADDVDALGAAFKAQVTAAHERIVPAHLRRVPGRDLRAVTS